MDQPTLALRPEVAARYALSAAGHTRLFVTRLDREVDLTQISLEEADELMALPGGFEWLVPVAPPVDEAGAVVSATAPARAKSKKGA
ncbi:hypothetical protein [Hymenobacter rubidus]|uniref:hypothetical protein n=1 Tax=Hymenobacter rubidus TaxID=1441626 RepID=UPI00191F97C4|nr:hypothetical protein [Hymenobacter rubidus]